MSPLAVSAVVVCGIVATRVLYASGNEAVQKVFGGIMNFFKSFMSFFKTNTEPGREYTEQKLKEIEKEDRETKRERQKEQQMEGKEERDVEAGRDETMQEVPFSDRDVKIEEAMRGEAIGFFVPKEWRELDDNQREAAVNRLVRILSSEMGLSKDYHVEIHDGITGIDYNSQILYVSKEDMQSVRWEASVDLYNALVKNVAYLRQNEIMDGISNPTRQEKELNAIIMDARDCDKAVINIPRTCFLGEFIHEFNGASGDAYITMPQGEEDMERLYLSMLQPSERIPTQRMDAYYDQLYTKMQNTEDEELDAEKIDYIDILAENSYKHAVETVKEMYGIRGRVEDAFDKVYKHNIDQNPAKQEPKDIKNLSMLRFAIGVAQMQSYAERNGIEFDSPRDIALAKIGGNIETMSDKFYNRDKALLDFYHVKVENVVPHKEWEAQKKERKEREAEERENRKNKGGDRDKGQKDRKDKEPKEEKPEKPEVGKDSSGAEKDNPDSNGQKDERKNSGEESGAEAEEDTKEDTKEEGNMEGEEESREEEQAEETPENDSNGTEDNARSGDEENGDSSFFTEKDIENQTKETIKEDEGLVLGDPSGRQLEPDLSASNPEDCNKNFVLYNEQQIVVQGTQEDLQFDVENLSEHMMENGLNQTTDYNVYDFDSEGAEGYFEETKYEEVDYEEAEYSQI